MNEETAVMDFKKQTKEETKIESLLTEEFSDLKKIKYLLEKILSANDNKKLIEHLYKKVLSRNHNDETISLKVGKNILKNIGDLSTTIIELKKTHPDEEEEIHSEMLRIRERAMNLYGIVGFHEKLDTLIKESKQNSSKLNEALKVTNEAIKLNEELVKEFKELYLTMKKIRRQPVKMSA